jgi:hypothetical protein
MTMYALMNKGYGIHRRADKLIEGGHIRLFNLLEDAEEYRDSIVSSPEQPPKENYVILKFEFKISSIEEIN